MLQDLKLIHRIGLLYLHEILLIAAPSLKLQISKLLMVCHLLYFNILFIYFICIPFYILQIL